MQSVVSDKATLGSFTHQGTNMSDSAGMMPAPIPSVDPVMEQRESLVQTAIVVNESYRTGDEEDRDLEIGFLYGTAEMIVSATLQDHESYNDLREELARRIDAGAAKAAYALIK